jgi:hypothetical protein
VAGLAERILSSRGPLIRDATRGKDMNTIRLYAVLIDKSRNYVDRTQELGSVLV